jgi:hypothetical protein
MNATAPARRALVLARPVKNTLPSSTVVKSKRSPQFHVLPADRTTTLCGIETSKWSTPDEVAAGAKVNCPLCAEALKAEAKAANAADAK